MAFPPSLFLLSLLSLSFPLFALRALPVSFALSPVALSISFALSPVHPPSSSCCFPSFSARLAQELKALSTRIRDHADALRRQEQGEPARPRSDVMTLETRGVTHDDRPQRSHPFAADPNGYGSSSTNIAPGRAPPVYPAYDTQHVYGARGGGVDPDASQPTRSRATHSAPAGNRDITDTDVIVPVPRATEPTRRRRRGEQSLADYTVDDALNLSQQALATVDELGQSYADDACAGVLSPHIAGLQRLHRVEYAEQAHRVEQEVKSLCDLGMMHQDEELALHLAEEEGRADEVLSRIEACHDPALVDMVASTGALPVRSRGSAAVQWQEDAYADHLDVQEHAAHPHEPQDLAQFDTVASSLLRNMEQHSHGSPSATGSPRDAYTARAQQAYVSPIEASRISHDADGYQLDMGNTPAPDERTHAKRHQLQREQQQQQQQHEREEKQRRQHEPEQPEQQQQPRSGGKASAGAGAGSHVKKRGLADRLFRRNKVCQERCFWCSIISI